MRTTKPAPAPHEGSSTRALRGATALGLAMLLLGCGIREHNVPEDRRSDPGPGGSGGDPEGGKGAGGDEAGGEGGNEGSGEGAGGEAGADAAPEPPAVEGIDIAGTRVPREKAIVILHIGHSNMLGHGRTPQSLREYFFTAQPRLWIYNNEGEFEPATEPTSSWGRSRSSAGPGMGLLRAAAALAPEDTHFISVGLGVGSATTLHWSKGGPHYERVVNLATELKGRVTFGAAVVMLGITDRHMPLAQQPGFAERVTEIAADLRADLETPDLPILHTDYEMESTGDLAPDSEVGLRFRPLILMLPELIDRCAIVPTDGLGMQDDHHFDMAGQKEWADRTMRILVDKGWAPWPTP